jgi:hypothetical protein
MELGTSERVTSELDTILSSSNPDFDTSERGTSESGMTTSQKKKKMRGDREEGKTEIEKIN